MGLKDVGDTGQRERDARKAAGKSNFNAEKTRYIAREFLGWVCYAGRTVQGEFSGHRVGVVADEPIAERWLHGDDAIHWDIPADPSGTLRG